MKVVSYKLFISTFIAYYVLVQSIHESNRVFSNIGNDHVCLAFVIFSVLCPMF